MFEKQVNILPEWIDSNGHLHDARYIDTCHLAVREFFEEMGIGESYKSEQGFAFFNLGMNLDYIREVMVEDPLRVTVCVVDSSDKLLHLFIEMRHAGDGTLKARHERLLAHVDMNSRRTTPFPDDVAARLSETEKADREHFDRSLLGRHLGIRRP